MEEEAPSAEEDRALCPPSGYAWRPIVVDGLNVAHIANKVPMATLLCDFVLFLLRCRANYNQIKIVLPESVCEKIHQNTPDRDDLIFLLKTGAIIQSPSWWSCQPKSTAAPKSKSQIQPTPPPPREVDDDQVTMFCAMRLGAVIISGDKFRDSQHKSISKGRLHLKAYLMKNNVSLSRDDLGRWKLYPPHNNHSFTPAKDLTPQLHKILFRKAEICDTHVEVPCFQVAGVLRPSLPPAESDHSVRDETESATSAFRSW